MKKLGLLLAGGGLLAASTSALAIEGTINLTAFVPVVCNVQFQGEGSPASDGGAVSLGSLRELCNAPNGYNLYLDYQPGTLVGAQVQVGSASVTLDGSGSVVLDSSPYPANQTRPLAIVPGEAGFDTQALSVRITPA